MLVHQLFNTAVILAYKYVFHRILLIFFSIYFENISLFSSSLLVQAPSGHMWGTFLMEREDGISFDCRIPPFSLDSTSNVDNNEYTE